MRIEILVREIREQKNMKFETLAKLAGISKGTLSKIERQEEEPKLSTMILIALALKVDVKELYKVHFWFYESVFLNFYKIKLEFYIMVSQKKLALLYLFIRTF